ncbi:MAG: nuclear transport factor 2 family protein [Alphaproteobacteria bacterium]|nr:nuclear transport factor 2 family protein [Alphaproteobacteria bacterium]
MRYVIVVLLSVAVSVLPALADDGPTEEAHVAVVAFINAVAAGPEAAARWLAPEFQIMRANGVGFDREGYLESGVARVSLAPGFVPEDLVVTVGGDIMVVRFFLHIDGTIDGEPIVHRAPRLAVFRRIEGQWKAAAYANFGATK